MNSNTNWLGNKINSPNSSNLVPDSFASIPTVTRYVDPDFTTSTQQPQTPIPLLPVTLQGPPPANEPGYVPYYLTQNIGRDIRAEFIIGTNQFVDKVGKLIEVGNNYFVLDDVNSRTHIMCDLYSVRFVTVI